MQWCEVQLPGIALPFEDKCTDPVCSRSQHEGGSSLLGKGTTQSTAVRGHQLMRVARAAETGISIFGCLGNPKWYFAMAGECSLGWAFL